MRVGRVFLFVTVMLALAATTAAAREPGKPGFSAWGKDIGLWDYHHVDADCDRIENAFGRNAAWGLWRLPLAQVVLDAPVEIEGGKARIMVQCRDDSSCIASGRLSETPDRIAAHDFTFDTPEKARAFAARIADLKESCGLEP